MRARPIAAAVALLVAAGGLAALPQAAQAASSGTLYVDQTNPACSDAGAGTQAAPYCTIQAAADAATAGDTVLIAGSAQPDWYTQSVTVTHSGTAAQPITFQAENGHFSLNGAGVGFKIQGAQYIDVVGLSVINIGATTPAVSVSDSSHITVDGARLDDSGVPLEVTGSSSDVAIERSVLIPDSPGSADDAIDLGSGVSGAVVTADIMEGTVSVQGTSGVDITGDDVFGTCGTSALTLTDAQGTSIENDILMPCEPATSTLAVDAASADSTTEGYNILETNGSFSTVPPYTWAGTAYQTAAAFQSATGQGTADDVVNSFDATTDANVAGNPAIDSANSDAPGELSTDVYGNAQTDNAAVPNTGAGTYSYYDRGAVSYSEFTALTPYVTVDGQRAEDDVDLQGVAWGDDATVTVDWGDGSAPDELLSGTGSDLQYFSALGDAHMYQSRGTYTITTTVTDDAQTVTKTDTVSTQGSLYVPVTPTRVLDTRNGTGATKTPVRAGGGVAVDVTGGVPGAPAVGTITAVVMNVTVTDAGGSGFVTAYPDGGALPSSSNVNYTKGETVANLVTVKVGADGKVDLYNGGATAGAIDLIADVSGYYVNSSAGGGYTPLSPDRLLDTRAGTGAPKAKVAAGHSVRLAVAGADGGALPASGITAVALNVTVTDAAGSGFVTASADGGAVPNASNVNYVAGETVPNMVIVPVGADGSIDLTNGGSKAGPVDLIADVAGYYTLGGGDAFVPMNPVRELDTRTGIGQESVNHYTVPANGDATWFFDDELQGEQAAVFNVTVTNPKAAGFLTAYPGGDLPNASNVNFTRGETVPNMVMVSTEPYGNVILHNTSSGTTDVIVDLFGYFS